MDEEILGDLFVCPFWFVDAPLLVNFFLAEINTAARLLADQPNMRAVFDAPDVELPRRRKCFELLAHRKLIEVLDDLIVARYGPLFSLNDLESRTLDQTLNLVPDDAPEWAREMKRVVDHIPGRIGNALPAPLQMEGYYPETEERRDAVRSAATLLSTVEQLQMFAKIVLDQQFQRLARRWPVTKIQVKQPNKRNGWQQKLKLYSSIQKVLGADPGLEGMEFCAELDKRHAPPLYDWEKRREWPEGFTWKEAWNKPGLRKKIRRVRQEAMKSR